MTDYGALVESEGIGGSRAGSMKRTRLRRRRRPRDSEGGAFMGAPFFQNVKASNISKIKAGLLAVQANTRNALFPVVGDSMTEGVGATDIDNVSNRAAAFPALMATQLNAADATLQALASSFWGLGGETSLANYTTYNPNAVFGADWVSSSGSDVLSFGGRFVQESAAGTTYFTYTPIAAFDRAIIAYRASATNTFTVEDDAAAVIATMNTGATTVVQFATVVMGKTCNFLKIKALAGNCSIIGISTFMNAQKRTMIWNMGWRGSFTFQWSLSSQGFNSLNAWDELLPDGVFVDLSVNDTNNLTPISQHETELTAICTAIKAAGADCVLSCGCPSDPASNPSQSVQNTYRQVYYRVAQALDLPLIDERALFVDWATANANGYPVGPVHYGAAANLIRANLRRDVMLAALAL